MDVADAFNYTEQNDEKAQRRIVRRIRRQAAEARFFRTLGLAMERVSWSGCRRSGSLMGILFSTVVRKRTRKTIANIQLAFPGIGDREAALIARRSAQNLCMSLCEFMHLPAASAQEIHDYVDWDGHEHIATVLEQGRGLIMLSAHLGNWELVGARLAQEFPMTVVARPRSNSALQDCFSRVRSAAGVQELLKFNAARSVMRALQKNGVVGLLPDEYSWRDGILLPMFDRPTKFTVGPARLALMAKAAIIPVFGVRRTPWLSDGRIIARVRPPLHLPSGERKEVVQQGTLDIIRNIENIVREYPEQWIWPHDRWKAEDMHLTVVDR